MDKSVEEYLNQILETVNDENPVIILDSENKDTILEMLKDKEDITAKILNIDSKDKLVIKRQKELENDINPSLLLKESNKLFREQKYEELLVLYNKLICHFESPKSYLYARVGTVYLRLRHYKDKALMYFELANELAYQENLGIDKYESIIYSLKNNVYIEKKTNRIRIEEYEFYDDMNDHYQIDNLDDICSLIKTQSLSFDEAKSKFNLSNEDIDIVKLVMAREYYSNKNIKAGNILFKQVEKSKNKTAFTKSLMKEIQANKKLYPYRDKSKVYVKTKENN